MTLFAHCDWCPKHLYFDELYEAGWIVNPKEDAHFCSRICAELWQEDCALENREGWKDK